MKFNFDNLNNEESVPEVPQTHEMTQEEFDMQIEKEAEKLGTSIQELHADIQKWGGPEEFKKKMDGRGSKSMFYSDGYKTEVKGSPFFYGAEGEGGLQTGPVGKEIVKDLNSAKMTKEQEAKTGLKAAAGALAFAIALEVFGQIVDEPGAMSIKEWVQNGAERLGDYAYPGLIGLFGAMSATFSISGIKDKIKANSIKRELAKQELKHKMTGVEFDQ